jgi:hypothetical protein
MAVKREAERRQDAAAAIGASKLSVWQSAQTKVGGAKEENMSATKC